MWQLRVCLREISFREEASGLNCSCVAFTTVVMLSNSIHWWPFGHGSTLVPCSPPFKLLSKGLSHFCDSTWSPLGSCKSGDHRWVSYAHRRGHGFAEFLCVLWAQWDSVCCLGLVLPCRERVRESSDRPHSSKSNTSRIHMPSLTHYWQHKWFMLPAICFLYFPHQICDIISWLCLSLITEDLLGWPISFCKYQI